MENNKRIDIVNIEIKSDISTIEKELDRLLEKANQLKSTLLSVTEIIDSLNQSEMESNNSKGNLDCLTDELQATDNAINTITKKYEKEIKSPELNFEQASDILSEFFSLLSENLADS